MLPRDQKALLVASAGGHLAQMLLVAELLDLREDSLWVTFDSAQSRSLLAGRRVAYVPYIRPRGYTEALRALPRFHRLLSAERFPAALSTGAAIAAPALLAATVHGVPSYYLESISRFDGPSLTGRLLGRVPRVRRYTQHASWAGARWGYDISIIEHLTTSTRAITRGERDLQRLFVTLGTIEPYRFDALVDNVKAVVPDHVQITWQLGSTTRSDLPGRVTDYVSAAEFDRLSTEADLVISHAGVGSALRLLNKGVTPLLVPRRRHRGEHVDDHQEQAARELERAGLLHVREAGQITAEDLLLSPVALRAPAPSESSAEPARPVARPPLDVRRDRLRRRLPSPRPAPALAGTGPARVAGEDDPAP